MLHENNNFTKVEGLSMILKGAFEYFAEDKAYSEEFFWVYKNFKDQGYIYESEAITRLENGEILKITVHYKVNKDMNPGLVEITKYIGNQLIEESYRLNPKQNILNYRYKDRKNTHKVTINPPPRFQIVTPNISSAFVFVGSKKYDPTGKNYFNLINSENFVEYKGPPNQTFVILFRTSTTPKDIKIKGNDLKGLEFHVYSLEDYEKKKEIPVTIYMSKFYSVPYLVDMKNDTKVAIKFLNEVDGPEPIF